ncbi:MAG: DUF692 domain-containing protein [Pseudomonadota bacterium]|nr:DUF692 domain-containing protein [Pseudomonadota bacterium]
MAKYDFLGFGLGLRPKHYQDVINNKPKEIDWFEVISEDYLIDGGNPLHYLSKIREDYPIVLHGVSLSIGSCDPIDYDYLQQLKNLSERIQPAWVSDHFCWTGVNGNNIHDLMPLPYTAEGLDHVVERIQRVQDFLGRRILLENPSSYVSYTDQQMSEQDFIRETAERADCLLLLDVNNVYVSSFNHNFNPIEYLDAIPIDRVQQFHMAGHTNNVTHIIDTHDHPIVDPVWNLFAYAVKRFGRVSAMIERDDNIPPLPELIEELERLKSIANSAWSETPVEEEIAA